MEMQMLLISAAIESDALHPQSGEEEPEDAGQTIQTKFGAAVLHPDCLQDGDARQLSPHFGAEDARRLNRGAARLQF